MHIMHLPSKTKGPHKKALVCYLQDSHTLPLHHPNFIGHSNYQECRTLLECLTEQGYSCDIIGYQDEARSLIGSEYDLLIAIRDQLEYGKLLVKETGKVVAYATGCHWSFHNAAEYDRLNQLKKRRGFSLRPKRQLAPALFEDQIDEIWHLGNDFQRDTYAHAKVPKHRINISVVPTPFAPKTTFTDEQTKNYLWFGSAGCVHKGLDWLLEIFAKHSELHLHVCGLVELEKDFASAFHHELYNLPNIHFHGWVLPNTEKYKQVTELCGFVVSPSASEGGGGATLQCMARGLVPIVTRSNSVNTTHCGYTFQADTLEEAEKAIHLASQLTKQELELKALSSLSFVQAEHTLDRYKASILERINNL